MLCVWIYFVQRKEKILSEQFDKMEFTHDISYLLDIFSYINEKKKIWGSSGTIRYLMGKKQTNKKWNKPEKALNGSLFQPPPLKILKSKNHVKFLIVEDMLLQAGVNSDKSLWISRAGGRFHMLEIIVGCVLNVIFIKC